VAFSAIGRLELLQNIFAPLLIPSSVSTELFPTGTVWPEARAAQEAINRATWLRVEALPHGSVSTRLRQKLGAGEAEAIALALKRQVPLVIDDLEARAEGRSLGLEVIGTLGIVARNKHLGTIPLAKPIIQAMHQAGIYYSESLIQHFLAGIGERS